MGPKPANTSRYIQKDDILLDHEVDIAHRKLEDGKSTGFLLFVAEKDHGGGRGSYQTIQVQETFDCDLDGAIEKLKDDEARFLVVRTEETQNKMACVMWLGGEGAGFHERAGVHRGSEQLLKHFERKYATFMQCEGEEKAKVKGWITD